MSNRLIKAIWNKNVIFWFVVAVALIFLAFPFFVTYSGMVMSVPIVYGVVEYLNPKTSDTMRLMKRLGGKTRVGYTLVAVFAVSFLAFLFSIPNPFHPMIMFVIGLSFGLSFFALLVLTPIAFHWEEWSKKVEEEDAEKNVQS
jgi:hypothetical protein